MDRATKFDTTVIHTMAQPAGSMVTGGSARAGSQRRGGITVEQSREVFWRQFSRRLAKAKAVRPDGLDNLSMFKVEYILALAVAILSAGVLEEKNIEAAFDAIPPTASGKGGRFTKTLHKCEGTRVIKKTVPQDNDDLLAAMDAIMKVLEASIKGDKTSAERRELAQFMLQSNYISDPERYFAAFFMSNGGWVSLKDVETYLFDLDQLTSLKDGSWIKFGGREVVGGQEVLHVTLVQGKPGAALMKALAECDAKEREVDPKGYVIVNQIKKPTLMSDEAMTKAAANTINMMCAGTVALTKVKTVMRCTQRSLLGDDAARILYLRVPILKSGASSVTVEYEFADAKLNRPNQKIRVQRQRPVVSAAEQDAWKDEDEKAPAKDYRKFYEMVMHDVASIVQQMVARMNAA